jgi:hypothetical protein
MKLVPAFTILAATVFADDDQQCGSLLKFKTFDGCLKANEAFKSSTCDILQDEFLKSKCICFYQRDILNCYPQCLDPGPQAEGKALLASAKESCADSGYPNFPLGLEATAPWRTDFSEFDQPPVVRLTEKKPVEAVEVPLNEEDKIAEESTSGSLKIAGGVLAVLGAVFFF